ncbi:SCO1664 family protein [Frankia sp. AgKG'84/4]|uniref:SCO1664 family protein n=1 Tax=Frankia sp. AgKG'84/4 TaxID=573490 RepID=UPI00200E9D85|nr:SCO1664 family protein [Frankia sp. AgKG'84/4]MCL9797304.1 SCO1664 family protein [Frankia sp. AgKG'84/4]
MGAPAVGPPPGRRPALDPVDGGGLDAAAALDLLRRGELTITARLTDASNATLYCEISTARAAGRCVYKPVRGERALWDFPDGTLAARELAAYEVSAALDLGIVPPTVLRDGPFGEGMVQLWIDTDITVDLVALTRSEDPQLRRIALFDAVINNADRKGGHLLPAPSGRVHGIDHGVTFHCEGKLRTLLWTWRGHRLDAEETALLGCLRDALAAELGERLGELLTVSELRALAERVDGLLDSGRFPLPSADWPPIPWPPF